MRVAATIVGAVMVTVMIVDDHVRRVLRACACGQRFNKGAEAMGKRVARRGF